MYKMIGNRLVLTVNDWLTAGLSMDQFKKDSKGGLLQIALRSINGGTTIYLDSVKRPDRLRVIEDAFGSISKEGPKSIFSIEEDEKARAWFLSHMPEGDTQTFEKVEEYTNRVRVFEAIRRGLSSQRQARSCNNQRINMGDFWKLATEWQLEKSEKMNFKPFANDRSFKRAYDLYLKDGNASVMHKGRGNDRARKVSSDMEKLFLALWRQNDKPFGTRVHELYLEFVAGDKEMFDKSTGEVFRPDDFRYKGRALEVSQATVWSYLKSVVNQTATFSDRNGNFDYVNRLRPKHDRKVGMYSLSKISMDDVAMSRQSVRGWVFKYMAVDVVSGYWFRPAYIVGKPTLDTVMESFQNMFCELSLLDLPMPGELEVEHHLMKDIKWLGDAFPFVRFCESPTEKRAEHAIRSLKYGAAKDAGHTRGRWYARHEAYRAVRNKESGDFIEPTYQPQAIIGDDLSDIDTHNNSLHPLQKRYPGMTRRQVLLSQVNPTLSPIEKWRLYRWIGNKTKTMIYNNDYCPVQGDKFELQHFGNLKRLKPNNWDVTAYWLPDEDGTISNVYLYQGDTYIGEAVNKAQYAYNECAIERTDIDDLNMLHQNKRLSKFDAFMKEQRVDIPRIGIMEASTSQIMQRVLDAPSDDRQTKELVEVLEEEEIVNSRDWRSAGRAGL